MNSASVTIQDQVLPNVFSLSLSLLSFVKIAAVLVMNAVLEYLQIYIFPDGRF